MEKQIYNRIKGALADAGVSNKELAEHLGVSEHTVSRWCTNDQQPSIKDLFRIADFLQINVQDLLVPNKLSTASSKKA
jgi:putative transcriptional regulator